MTDSSPNVVVYSPDEVESAWSYANPFRLAQSLWRRRQLIAQLVQREIQGRYRGSYLGIVWAMITPLFTLAVYTFIFSVVARLQWPGGKGGFIDYALHMFSGLIAYGVFAECASAAPVLIIGNPNYVKKVVFPLEILPVTTFGSALIHSLCSLVILILTLAVATRQVHWTIVMLPLAYIPLAGFSLGVGWLLSSLGVFIRDTGHIIRQAVHLLFFLTPISYPKEQVGALGRFMWLNPLASVVDTFRCLINEGDYPDWRRLGAVTAVSIAVALFGHMWFMKMKRALADVI